MRESTTKPSRRQAGMSMTELLLIVGIIAIIATVAIPTISRLRDSAKKAAATQNAKNVAQMSEALAALGVAHVIPDSLGGPEATARLLREGVVVPEGPMAGERFILSGMRESEIEETAEYLKIEYGDTYLRLVYSPPSDRTGTTLFHSYPSDRILLAQSDRLSSVLGTVSMSGFSGHFLDLAL